MAGLIDPEALLRQLFDLAVATADPMRVVAQHLPPRPKGRLVVIGAGKASARMAEAVEAHYGPCEGLVITRYGYGRPCQGIEIVEAAHPVPDAAGVAATARMLALLRDLGPQDQVLALISGGGSALLCAPAFGMTLAEKQAVNARLLASGAPISAMNLLRKHLSLVKGGQLAAASAAPMLALMISDVPGDDPGLIASGPTVAEASSSAEALAVADRWQVVLPEAARLGLSQGSGVMPPGDARLARVENRVIAAPAQSLAAAKQAAVAAGCAVVMLGDALEGEAREVGRAQAVQAKIVQAKAVAQGEKPVLLLSGGELTVTRCGDGSGGPNAEFCLAAAIELDGAAGIYVLAGDTDGVDGAAEVAGACFGPDILTRASAAEAALAINDSHGYFGRAGAQIVTGPTLTNVNDFRAILVMPQG